MSREIGEIAAKFSGMVGMTEALEGNAFDLADAFAGETKFGPDLLEDEGVTVYTITKTEDFGLSRGEGVQDGTDLSFENDLVCFIWSRRTGVGDKIT